MDPDGKMHQIGPSWDPRKGESAPAELLEQLAKDDAMTRWSGRIAGNAGGQNDPGSVRCGCCGAEAVVPNRAARRDALRVDGTVPKLVVKHKSSCPCIGHR
jgi:hypothetical protein